MKRTYQTLLGRLVVSAVILSLSLLLLFTLPAGAAGADGGSDSSTTTGLRPTAGSQQTDLPVVSFGLRVLAAREEMVLSGLCGNEISFAPEDIRRAMNLSELNYITLTRLPDPGDGTLFIGATGAAVGQVISAANLSLMSFAAADDEQPCDAEIGFFVNGGGYEITCHLCLLEHLNYTPTVSLAPAVSLSVLTYCDLTAVGTLSAYDPEGDEVTFEIVRYASHGRVTLTDKHTGAYTYTPDKNFAGQDEFQYVVRDQYGNYSTSATVRITVGARPASVNYADIEDSTYAGAALRISATGIMNGTQVGNACYFKPNESISRAEFLVTAMNAAGIGEDDLKAAGLEGNSRTVYADNEDIPTSMQGYVALATTRGYVTGKTVSGSLCFCPDESITRAEAAVILSNIIGYATQTTVNAFADADTVPAWSMEALTSLRSLGVLISSDGNAGAAVVMTRGETAEWLCKTIQLMGQ